MTILELE